MALVSRRSLISTLLRHVFDRPASYPCSRSLLPRFQYCTISQRTKFNSNKSSSLVVSRLTMPDDANPLGIVHGGVILNMIEEAGLIASTKYVNANRAADAPEAATGLVRVERMVFKKPVYVGEVVDLEVELLYTSKHSLMIEVDVYAENIYKATKRLTNRARLWYVAVNAKEPAQVAEVPAMVYESPDEEEAGYRAHQIAKKDRTCSIICSTPNVYPSKKGDMHTVEYSQGGTLQLVHPSSCLGNTDFCRGGTIMKWMDECAGLVAAKHCLNPLVTLSMDATNFHKMCTLGTSLSMVSRVTFTSRSTVEVQCIVDAEYPFHGRTDVDRAVEAFFTFVSFDQNRKILPVPQLKIKTKDEQIRFDAGQKRYEERKRSG